MTSERIRSIVGVVGGYVLLALGLITFADRVILWSACPGVYPRVGDTLQIPAACVEVAGSTSADERLPLWMTAIALCLLVAFTHNRRKGLIAFCIALVVNPILDPGFFWMMNPLADAFPASGVLPSVATIIAGVICVVPAQGRPNGEHQHDIQAETPGRQLSSPRAQ